MARVATRFQVGFAGVPVLEAPTGLLNGSNTSYALSHTPVSNTLTLFLNGLYQTPGVDYTLSVLTITMTVAPPLGGDLRAVYRY